MAMQTMAADQQAPADPEQTAKDLERFQRDLQYLSTIRAGLMDKDRGRWAAIFDGRVVSIADTPEQLVVSLQEAGVPRARAVIDHLVPDAITVC